MKKTAILSILFLTISTIALHAQTERRTFQGEIADKAFFLHLESTGRVINGFYKYQTDSLVVPIKGNIDKEGNIELTGKQEPFPSFSGRLRELTIKGTFKETKSSDPETFYAVNLHNMFKIDIDQSGSMAYTYRFSGIEFSLIEEGYKLYGGRYFSGTGFITTQEQPDGSIYLLCESLNAKMLLSGYSLFVDTTVGLPTHNPNAGQFGQKVVFTSIHKDNLSESQQNWQHPVDEIKLNDNYSIKRRPLWSNEYTVRNWESAHLRHQPFKKITNIDEAKKLLGNRLKITEINYDDGVSRTFEITFKDGVKKKLGNEEFGYFGAYYPELDILSIEEYGFFDLGNSKIEQAENPDYSILSPDKQWLINTQHYKNGCPFLKKRNNTTGKYEFIGDFHDIIHYNNNWESWFCSTQKWFWISNNKVFFTTGSGGKSYDGQPYEAEYSYEIEIVQTESAEKNDDCP